MYRKYKKKIFLYCYFCCKYSLQKPCKVFFFWYFCCIFSKVLKYFFYMSYIFIKSLLLLTLSDVNSLFISKIVLTASPKLPLWLIISFSNLYSLKILSLLFSISSIIIWFSSFLYTVFISFSTNAANLWPNIFSNNCSSRSFKIYAAFAEKIL